jgi:hypothetical protein
MIDRRAALISAALILVMVAASIFRIALLPDWAYMPSFGPHGEPGPLRSSLILFFLPGTIVFVVSALWLSGKPVSSSHNGGEVWRALGTFSLVGYSVIMTLLQIYLLLSSYGMGIALGPFVGRIGFCALAALVIVRANQIPKLPWRKPRLGIFPDLGPIQGAKFHRFSARLNVGSTIALLIIAPTIPPSTSARLIFLLLSTMLMLIIVRAFQLQREKRRENARPSN